MRKIILTLIVIVLVLLIIGEIAMRIIGYPTYKYIPMEWKVQPKNFLIYDSLLGYKTDRGIYTYKVDGKLYTSTHDSEGHRITSLQVSTNDASTGRTINFLGGTNVYGLEMSDEETLPFLFQEMYPAFKVSNLAVPEYGMAANYVLLTKYNNIKKGDIFVCMYFSAHDSRPPRKILKAAYAGVKSKTLEPFPSLSIDDNLQVRLNDYNYRLWPLNSYSALINFSEDQYNKYADKHSKAHETAKKVMVAISDTCKTHGATFVLIGRRSDNQTLKMLEYCSKNGVHATYLPMAGKSLLKNPSDKIQDKKRFAAKLMDYLQQNKIIDSTEHVNLTVN